MEDKSTLEVTLLARSFKLWRIAKRQGVVDIDDG